MCGYYDKTSVGYRPETDEIYLFLQDKDRMTVIYGDAPDQKWETLGAFVNWDKFEYICDFEN